MRNKKMMKMSSSHESILRQVDNSGRLFQDREGDHEEKLVLVARSGKINRRNLKTALRGWKGGDIWPEEWVRRELECTYRRVEVRESRILGAGRGLFAAVSYDAGETVGVYGGTVGIRSEGNVNRYSMDLEVPYNRASGGFRVDGTPNDVVDHTVFGRINDYVWLDEMQNCIVTGDGIINTTRGIKKGEELYMSYGDEYDWVVLEEQFMRIIEGRILMVVDRLEIGLERLKEVAELVRSDMREMILRSLFRKNQRQNVKLHWSEVQYYGQTNQQLIEQITTCGAFHRVSCMGRLDKDKPFNVMEMFEKVVGVGSERLGGKLRKICRIDYSGDGERVGGGEVKRNVGLLQERWPRQPEVEGGDGESSEVKTGHCGGLGEAHGGISGVSRSESTEDEHKCNEITGMDKGELKIITYNCGTLTKIKWDILMSRLKDINVDIVVLIDTRHVASDIWKYKDNMQGIMGCGYNIVHADAPGYGGMERVGGQIILYGPKVIKDQFVQVMQRGSLTKMTVKYGGEQVTLLATYWPVKETGINSLMAKLKEIYSDPIEMVKYLIKREIERSKEGIVIVVGDFNSDVNGEDIYDLRKFMIEASLQHASDEGELREPSRYRYVESTVGATRLDYCLYTGKKRKTSSVPRRVHSTFADHTSLYTTIAIGTSVTGVRVIMRLVPAKDIDREDKRACCRLGRQAKRMVEKVKGTPEEVVEMITRETVKLVRGKGGRKRDKNGWSPEMMSLIITLRNIVLIRRHVHGYKGYRKWNENTYKGGMDRVRNRWRSQLARLNVAGEGKERNVCVCVCVCW